MKKSNVRVIKWWCTFFLNFFFYYLLSFFLSLLCQGGGGALHIPESSGAAVALGRDGKPAELRENRCEREVQRDRSHRPRGIPLARCNSQSSKHEHIQNLQLIVALDENQDQWNETRNQSYFTMLRCCCLSFHVNQTRPVSFKKLSRDWRVHVKQTHMDAPVILKQSPDPDNNKPIPVLHESLPLWIMNYEWRVTCLLFIWCADVNTQSKVLWVYEPDTVFILIWISLVRYDHLLSSGV